MYSWTWSSSFSQPEAIDMASSDSPCSGAYYGDLEVEVKAENGSYFKAYIVDIFENEVVVAYEDEWRPRCKVALADVRLPEFQTGGKLNVGDHAEVFSRAKKTEPCGYWTCKIIQEKGDFFVIEYTSLGANFVNEIVEQDRLRPPNRNPPIASKSFYKCIIELPDSLRDVCEDMSLHRDLLKACNARMIVGDKHAGTLTMLSQSEDLIYRAEMLADIHVRSLPTKVLLKQRAAERVPGSAEVNRPSLSAKSSAHDFEVENEGPVYPYTDEFSVAEDLLGLSIGARGSNLTAAKGVRGVLSVELNDSNSTFYIGGETKEAVDQARLLLEYMKVTTFIPKAFAGRMIGKGGAKMQEIVNQAGVVRASTELVNDNGDVPFVFVGRRKAVEHARLLLDYHFLLMKELDDLSTVRARDAPAQSFRRSWFPQRGDSDRSDRRQGDDIGQSAGGGGGGGGGGRGQRQENGQYDGRSAGAAAAATASGHGQGYRQGNQSHRRGGGHGGARHDEQRGYDDASFDSRHQSAGMGRDQGVAFEGAAEDSHASGRGRNTRGRGKGRQQQQQPQQQQQQQQRQQRQQHEQQQQQRQQRQQHEQQHHQQQHHQQQQSGAREDQGTRSQQQSHESKGSSKPARSASSGGQQVQARTVTEDTGAATGGKDHGSRKGTSQANESASKAVSAEQEKDWGKAETSTSSTTQSSSSSTGASASAGTSQKNRGPRNTQQPQQGKQKQTQKDDAGEKSASTGGGSGGKGKIPNKSSNQSIHDGGSAGSGQSSPKKSSDRKANKGQGGSSGKSQSSSSATSETAGTSSA